MEQVLARFLWHSLGQPELLRFLWPLHFEPLTDCLPSLISCSFPTRQTLETQWATQALAMWCSSREAVAFWDSTLSSCCWSSAGSWASRRYARWTLCRTRTILDTRRLRCCARLSPTFAMSLRSWTKYSLASMESFTAPPRWRSNIRRTTRNWREWTSKVSSFGRTCLSGVWNQLIICHRNSRRSGSVHTEQCEASGLQQLHLGVLCALQGTQHLLGHYQLNRVQDGHALVGQLKALGTGWRVPHCWLCIE